MQSVTEIEIKWSKKILIKSMLFSITLRFQITMFLAVGYAPVSSSDPLILILLSEVEQEQKPSGGKGYREAIVVGAGLCDGEGERAYTIYDPHFSF